jgi:hypothetical protein
MRAFERMISRVAFVVDAAAAVFLAIITTLTFVAVLMRYVFNLPFPGSFDVSRLLLGVAIFWGIAAAPPGAASTSRSTSCGSSCRCAPSARSTSSPTSSSASSSGHHLDALLAGLARAGLAADDLRAVDPIWPFHGIAWLGIAFCTLVLLARILRAIVNFNAPAPNPRQPRS